MNRVLSKLGTDVQPWKTSEVERLLDESPLNDCALHYPPQVSARLVQQLYRAGALLLPEDLGVYLRGQRGRRTQAQLARHSGLARAAISRIELGQLERSKLVDIIALDQALDAHGELLGMIWQARPLLERHWTPRELRLARLRLILDRWTRVLERRPASR
jgi:transcriptional regulator with XRE-family HTH domain